MKSAQNVVFAPDVIDEEYGVGDAIDYEKRMRRRVPERSAKLTLSFQNTAKM